MKCRLAITRSNYVLMAELDEEHPNWFVRVENQFKEKLLHVLGGIGAWGALFPLFYAHCRETMGTNKASDAFLAFLLLYIMAPIVMLLLWLWFSGRLKKDELTRLKKVAEENKPAHRFSPIILKCIFRLDKVFIFFSVLLIVVIPLLTLLYCPNRPAQGQMTQNQKKGSAGSVDSAKTDTAAKGLAQFNLADDLWKELNSLERKVKNIADRYLIKSKISIERYETDYLKDLQRALDTLEQRKRGLTKDSIRVLTADQAFLRNFKSAEGLEILVDSAKENGLHIRPYLTFFNALILYEGEIPDTVNIDSMLYASSKSSLNLDASYKNFYSDSTFFKVDRVVMQWHRHAKQHELPFVYVITATLDTMLMKKDQRIYPDSVHLEPTLITRLDSLNLDTVLFKNYLTALLNYQNGVELYRWVEDFKAFCQRKVQSELDLKRGEIARVWSAGRDIGLISFASILLFLGFIWFSLGKIKDAARKNNGGDNQLSKDDRDIKVKELNDQLQTINHYIFPISTFFMVLLALSAAFLKEVKPEDIQFTSPNWMLNSSNWNLITATAEAVDKNNPDDKPDKKDSNTGDVAGDDISELNTRLDTLQQKLGEMEEHLHAVHRNTDSIHDFVKLP